jgi:NADP-dependent 3-hydroxy acid dehydrogenase YdfG
VDESLEGRTAVVSGGAAGIGRAIVDELVATGCFVYALDLEEGHRPWGANAVLIRGDVASAGDVADASARVHGDRGGADVLVCNAGVGLQERLAEGDPEKWRRLLDVNLVGALRLVRAFVPRMLERGRGDVVFISSVAADKPHPYGGVYAASKAALDVVAETLRLEAQPTVRVTVVAPGVVDTGFFARAPGHAPDAPSLGLGWLEPGDVAAAVRFALTRRREASVDRILLRPSSQAF